MSWTDERVETLKRMWGEGQSASAIAKELGGVTRNAVIGKVHRLGLSNRNDDAASDSTKTADTAKKAEKKAPKPAAAAKPEPAPAAEPEPVEAKPAEIVPETPLEEANDDPVTESAAPPASNRNAVVTAGQPLPPQPSANEISPEALASVREVEKGAKKLSLMELTERTCKWPIGDPATEKFWFCGLPSQPGKPYCEAHIGVAFQPMSSRRDRRR